MQEPVIDIVYEPCLRFLSMGQMPKLMTVKEAAEVLLVADETIHRWVREGHLDYADVNGLKRLFRQDIELLVARRNATADAVADAPAATARGG